MKSPQGGESQRGEESPAGPADGPGDATPEEDRDALRSRLSHVLNGLDQMRNALETKGTLRDLSASLSSSASDEPEPEPHSGSGGGDADAKQAQLSDSGLRADSKAVGTEPLSSEVISSATQTALEPQPRPQPDPPIRRQRGRRTPTKASATIVFTPAPRDRAAGLGKGTSLASGSASPSVRVSLGGARGPADSGTPAGLALSRGRQLTIRSMGSPLRGRAQPDSEPTTPTQRELRPPARGGAGVRATMSAGGGIDLTFPNGDAGNVSIDCGGTTFAYSSRDRTLRYGGSSASGAPRPSSDPPIDTLAAGPFVDAKLPPAAKLAPAAAPLPVIHPVTGDRKMSAAQSSASENPVVASGTVATPRTQVTALQESPEPPQVTIHLDDTDGGENDRARANMARGFASPLPFRRWTPVRWSRGFKLDRAQSQQLRRVAAIMGGGRGRTAAGDV